MDDNLELVIKDKVKPMIDEATERHLGISIDKLTEDISLRLGQSTLIDISIDTKIPYKEAKRMFKTEFLRKLLLLNLGNISEVARLTGQDRRSIHRLIAEFNINVRRIKKELIKPYDIKVSAISHAIEDVLDDYRSILNPTTLRKMYLDVPSLSEGIIKQLPEAKMTFKEAQIEFEKRYFGMALKENNHNVTKTAKKIGLRYETLCRKLKALGMI